MWAYGQSEERISAAVCRNTFDKQSVACHTVFIAEIVGPHIYCRPARNRMSGFYIVAGICLLRELRQRLPVGNEAGSTMMKGRYGGQASAVTWHIVYIEKLDTYFQYKHPGRVLSLLQL